MGVKLGLSP